MVAFSASVCIFLFTEAFFLSILLFWVLVSLDDFSYAGLSPTASFSGLAFCAAWTHWLEDNTYRGLVIEIRISWSSRRNSQSVKPLGVGVGGWDLVWGNCTVLSLRTWLIENELRNKNDSTFSGTAEWSQKGVEDSRDLAFDRTGIFDSRVRINLVLIAGSSDCLVW